MVAAVFLGTKDFKLKTFTTSYASLNGGGWSWLSSALAPLQYVGWRDAANNIYIGMGVAVFDYATGLTTFKYGDLASGSVINFDGGANWIRSSGNGGRIAGWVFNNTLTHTPQQFAYNIVLGTNVTSSALPLQMPFILPSLSNTAIPAPDWGGNWLDQDNAIVCSYIQNSVHSYAYYGPASSQVVGIGAAPSALGFVGALGPKSSIPFNGMNYIWVENGTPPYKLIYGTKTFLDLAANFTPNLTNPPGSSIDLNAYINAQTASSPTSTYQGFMWINRAALTFTGGSLNGFGILLSPDGLGYYLINFIPIDSTAANWQTGISDIQAKFDDTGYVWMKMVSSATTIYTGIPVETHIVPTFPPVPLIEPEEDTQITLKAFRGYSI